MSLGQVMLQLFFGKIYGTCNAISIWASLMPLRPHEATRLPLNRYEYSWNFMWVFLITSVENIQLWLKSN